MSFSDLVPQFIATVQDESIGLKGYVVIDTTINNSSCGGLRMHSGLNLEELKGLARAMTLKYSFNNFVQGGAKAGIAADAEDNPERKRKLLRRFAELIYPLLKTRCYNTGPDMSTTQDDINDMFAHVGLKFPRQRRDKGQKSGFYTALAVMIAAEAAANYKNMDLSKSTVAIEGFGAVGSSLSWLMAVKKKAHVVAVSTSRGALYRAGGLNIKELLELRKEKGNDFVNSYKNAELIEKEKLLTLKVDILFPCATYHTIHHGNMKEIQAPIVCSGANIPATAEAEKYLFAKGIICPPYFAANCGGIIGNKIEVTGLGEDYVEDFLRKLNFSRLINLIKKAEAEKRPAVFIAEEQAFNNFQKMKDSADNTSAQSWLYKRALNVFNMGILPKWITKKFGAYYFEKFLNRNSEPGQVQ